MLLVYRDQDNENKSEEITKAGADAENTMFSILMAFKLGSWMGDGSKNATEGSDSVGSKWRESLLGPMTFF